MLCIVINIISIVRRFMTFALYIFKVRVYLVWIKQLLAIKAATDFTAEYFMPVVSAMLMRFNVVQIVSHFFILTFNILTLARD